MIALTFDDGPSQNTSHILDLLEEYDVRATFFVVGNRVSSYADTAKRAVALGNEIGITPGNTLADGAPARGDRLPDHPDGGRGEGVCRRHLRGGAPARRCL